MSFLFFRILTIIKAQRSIRFIKLLIPQHLCHMSGRYLIVLTVHTDNQASLRSAEANFTKGGDQYGARKGTDSFEDDVEHQRSS